MNPKIVAELQKDLREFVLTIIDDKEYARMYSSIYVGFLTKLEEHHKPQVSLHYDEVEHRYSFGVTVNGYTIVKFQFQYYPACCAACMFHHFTYHGSVSKKVLFGLMDLAISRVIWHYSGAWKTRRLMVMMVESRGELYKARREGLHAQFDNIKPSADEIQNSNGIDFPYFFEYFHKQKKVNTRLMYNANTGNLIHDMEVLFDPDNPPKTEV